MSLEYKFKTEIEGVELRSEKIDYNSACDLAIRLDYLGISYELTEYEKRVNGDNSERIITHRELIAGV